RTARVLPGWRPVGERLPGLHVVVPRRLANQDVDVLDRRVDGLVHHPGDGLCERPLLLGRAALANVALNDGHLRRLLSMPWRVCRSGRPLLLDAPRRAQSGERLHTSTQRRRSSSSNGLRRRATTWGNSSSRGCALALITTTGKRSVRVLRDSSFSISSPFIRGIARSRSTTQRPSTPSIRRSASAPSPASRTP